MTIIFIIMVFSHHLHIYRCHHHEDLLAGLDDLLRDPLAIVEEAVVRQGMLEYIDLTRPLEYP